MKTYKMNFSYKYSDRLTGKLRIMKKLQNQLQMQFSFYHSIQDMQHHQMILSKDMNNGYSRLEIKRKH